jgi:hypothetical protein
MNDRGKLHFEEESAPFTSGQNVPKSKKPHKQFRENGAQAPPSERLRQDTPPGNTAANGAGKTPGGQTTSLDKKAARDGKRFNHSKLRMEKTGAKLEKAVDKKTKQKPYKRPGMVKSIRQAATYEGMRYIHGKIYQQEHENVGVESAHKTELAGERVVRGTTRFVRQRNRTRPARRVRKWERRDIKAKADFQYKKMTQENPLLKKNALSRFIQKQRNKRRYQKQAREAVKKGAKAAKKTAVTTEKIAAAVGRLAIRHPVITLIAVAVFLLIVTMQSCMGTVTMVGNGMMGAVGGVAQNADTLYTGFETELQQSIDNIETAYPGYDEYRRTIGPIGHNPAELFGFLSVCDPFPEAEMESVLREVFDAQYTLTVEEIIETSPETEQTTTETGTVTQPTESGTTSTTGEIKILAITLTVKPFSEAVAVRLTPAQLEQFNQYDYTQ